MLTSYIVNRVHLNYNFKFSSPNVHTDIYTNGFRNELKATCT